MPVYLALQLIRCAARNVAIAPGGLLPRLFTLALPKQGGCFLSHCLCPRKQLPVRKYDALCCPDFPHAAHTRIGVSASDRPPYCLVMTKLMFSCVFFKKNQIASCLCVDKRCTISLCVTRCRRVNRHCVALQYFRYLCLSVCRSRSANWRYAYIEMIL